MKNYLIIILIILLVGCTPVGKVGESFDMSSLGCFGSKTPVTKEIGISQYAGKDITLRFNHIACGTDVCSKVFLKEVEFLDENGNIIPKEEEEPKEFELTQQNIDNIVNLAASKGIQNLKIYQLGQFVAVDYHDAGPYSEEKLNTDLTNIIIITISELKYPIEFEVRHFKGEEPDTRIKISATDLMQLLIGQSSSQEFSASLNIEPFTWETTIDELGRFSITPQESGVTS